ncbi:MAG: YdeI/OmpD-associated family protein [Usitatibacter sp.]
MSHSFDATVQKVDINPYVRVPAVIVHELLYECMRETGPIPVRGTLQGKRISATVVKFRGLWRLYLNGPMRSSAGVDVGDEVTVMLDVDSVPRKTRELPEFTRALAGDPKARKRFDQLAPYRQKEILRYLANIKTPETLDRNLGKVIDFLNGRKVTGLVAITR